MMFYYVLAMGTLRSGDREMFLSSAFSAYRLGGLHISMREALGNIAVTQNASRYLRYDQ